MKELPRAGREGSSLVPARPPRGVRNVVVVMFVVLGALKLRDQTGSR